MRWACACLVSVITLLSALTCAHASELTRERLAEIFPAPMEIGERDANFPVWPLFNGGGGESNLAGWIFETTDLAPIPGFSGTPPNLLIALAPDGTFIDVRVISQHEPVFLDGLGEEPLFKFVEQYRGKTLGRPVKVGSNINSAERSSSGASYINGISKATASVLIINQTVLASAIKVAKAKLGIAGASASATPATPNASIYEPMTWKQLLDKGLVQRVTYTNADIEKLFAGTIGEGLDEKALAEPHENAVDLYLADPLVPSVGRALLGDKAYEKLLSDLTNGQPAILVISAGRWSAQGEDWTPGSVPDRIVIKQANFPIVVRDVAFNGRLPLEGLPSQEVMILKIPATAGFDPASPFEVVPHITRAKGIIYPDLVSVDPAKSLQWPGAYYLRPEPENDTDGVLAVWQDRAGDLFVLALMLPVLGLALTFQRRLTRSPFGFRSFRLAFLFFTLVFVGWHAQAQLSVVTLAGLVKAALHTHDFTFLLWDPPSLVLWAITIVSFVIWGRGTFCGWLCPFGALQELFGEASRFLNIRQIRVPERIDRVLRKLKYVVLAGILLAALSSSPLSEIFAEIEPFKTSITLTFVRYWPFAAYAAALLIFNLFVYKAFCRYLCPLGAMMAIGGKLRVLDWIPRRAECGTPCQLCAVRCRYGSIRRNGSVDYDECFQCLDCIQIFDDRKICVPLVLHDKGRRTLSQEISA